MLQELRTRLVEWQAAGAMKSRREVDEVIKNLATTSGMEHEAVRVLWLSVARQARPVGAPVATYIALAKKHHEVEVEVIDLGQFSAERSNSCMFLTASAALADRKAKGYADACLPGVLGALLEEAAPDGNAMAPIDDLVEQHRRTRLGTLGRMADALRHAACEVLAYDEEFFLPYFHPVRGGLGKEDMKKAYHKWLEKLRGDEEGDELVILALARLVGMAIQPVQQSGYRVPLMDPTGAAEGDNISYWGNDDRHWVWLRPVEASTLAAPAAGAPATSSRSDAGTAAAAPAVSLRSAASAAPSAAAAPVATGSAAAAPAGSSRSIASVAGSTAAAPAVAAAAPASSSRSAASAEASAATPAPTPTVAVATPAEPAAGSSAPALRYGVPKVAPSVLAAEAR